METVIFKNRREAGRQLAAALMRLDYTGKSTLILGIPRGGLVVADEVAKALSATLDVIIARKLRAPYQPELGIGAVVDGDHIVLNQVVVPVAFHAVGAWYERFDQLSDEEAAAILRRNWSTLPLAA